jgi:hypothetical protein
LHLQYLAKSQSTQHYQSLITPGSDHPLVLELHRFSLMYTVASGKVIADMEDRVAPHGVA